MPLIFELFKKFSVVFPFFWIILDEYSFVYFTSFPLLLIVAG